MNFLEFDTTKLTMPECYKFLIGAIVPRPIALVSTVNKNGTNNLAPFSFFTGVCPEPMIVAFCPVIRTSNGKKKDTLINIEREKEFVINFCHEDIIEQVNLCSSELEYGEDEFALSKLTPMDSKVVQAKRVKESHIHFECFLRDILSYGESIGNGSLITGEVKHVSVSKEVFHQGKIITEKFRPIGRGAGNDWIKATDRVQIERLMASQIQK